MIVAVSGMQAPGAARSVPGNAWFMVRLLLPRRAVPPSWVVVKHKAVPVLKRSPLVILFLALAFVAVPTFAGPMPSKALPNQSLASRNADLALVRTVAANEQVARVLAEHGLTQQQVSQKLAQLSPQDLHQLAQNLDQIQAAGLTQQEWIWIGIGALAALILVVALS